MPLRFFKEGSDYEFGDTEHDTIHLGHVDETPTDADIGVGNTAFYAKSDGGLYKRPYGGTEVGIGSGGGGGGDFNHTLTQTLDAQGNDISNADTVQARKTATGPLSVLTANAGRGGIYGAHKPAGVYAEEANTTFWCFRGEGAHPYVSAYDHDRETQAEIQKVADSTLGTGDNHGPPSMAIGDDGTIHILFGAHDSHFQYARSVNPYDTSEWEDMGYLDTVPHGTYPSMATLNGDIYAFYRTGDHGNSGNMDYPNHDRATIIRTQDGGDTWEDLGPVIDITDHPNRPCDVYVQELRTHDGMLRPSWHFALSEDGGHDENRSHVLHGAYDPATDQWEAMDGTTYTSPITWSDINGGPLQAFSDYAGSVSTYIDSDGTPHIAFAHFNETTSEVEIRHAWYDAGWSDEYIGQTAAVFCHSAIRRSERGVLEIHGVTNTSLSGDGGQAGERSGGYTLFEQIGGTWESTVMLDKHDATVHNVQAVRNGSDELSSLAIEYRPDNRNFDARVFAGGSIDITTSTRLAGKQPTPLWQKEQLTSEPNPGDFFLNWGSSGGGTDRLHLGVHRPSGPDSDTLALVGSTNWFNRIGMQFIGSQAGLIVDGDGTLDHNGSTTVDPTLPDTGVRKYLRTDTPSPQYRMRDSDGAIASLPLNDGTVVSDGDGTERRIWVVPAGGNDPTEASDDDIIFEEEN